MRLKYFGLCFILVLLVISAAAFRLRLHIEAVEVGVDDANIFFVYARNLSQGHGFVWNIGEPPVEGFSSALWLLLITPFFKASIHPEFALFLFSILLLAFGIATTFPILNLKPSRGDREKTSRPVFTALLLEGLFFMWLFAQPMYLIWTSQTLMETGLWSALILVATSLATFSAIHPTPSVYRRLFRCCLPLLLLARPEGMMWAGVLLTAEAAGSMLAGASIAEALRRFVISLAVYVAALIALTAARMLYFGFPLPNTYYAKISPDRSYTLRAGWEYATAFLRSQRALPIFTLCALALAGAFGALTLTAPLRPRRYPPSLIAAFIYAAGLCAGLLAPVLVGGDHFDGFRFYQPIWPMLIIPPLLLSHMILDRLAQHAANRMWRPLRAAVLIAIIAALFWGCFPQIQRWKDVPRARLVDEFRLAREGRELGHALNRVFKEPFPAVGAIAVGGIKYTYRGAINDLMGLSNIEMAHHPGERKGIKNHAAFSKEVFYRQRPEVMIPIALPLDAADFINRPPPDELARYVRNRWVLEPLQGLPRDAEFRAVYTLCLVSRADMQAPESIGAFLRHDFLELLRSNTNYVIATF